MAHNVVSGLVHSPPQEGPYSAMKTHCIPGGNSGQKGTTPGGSFIDRMRNVLHNTAAAGQAAAERPSSAKRSSSGNSSAWGDTPDTAEMEYITKLEREALRQRLENSVGLAPAALPNVMGIAREQTAAAAIGPPCAGPRQFTFSPAAAESLAAVGPIPRPGSGRLRSSNKRQMSHLGRTSLASAAAAAAAAVIETLPHPQTLHPQIDVVRPQEVSIDDRATIEAIKRQKVVEESNRIGTQQAIQYPEVRDAACDVVFDSSDDEEAAVIVQDPSEATKAIAVTPPPIELRAYLSPDVAEAILRIGGPEKLYQWQAECLCRPGVLQGRNLVYCAPTSGGKSLVADIIFLRRLVETGRPGLLVLPFISLCNEKKSYWDNVLQSLDREAREYYGPTSNSAPISPRTGIIVGTLEKANHLITHLMEENALSMLSCIIIDELHMVGDEHRGYQLELMLTKLRFAGAAAFEQEEEVEEDRWVPMMGLEEGTQIIGMSATLPNVNIIATWLGAELFTTEFRPVPLCQFLKVGNLIKDETGAVVRTIPDKYMNKKELQGKDTDHVAFLAQETVDEGFSVLVFCATRSASEATSTLLSQLVEIPERHIPIKRDILASLSSKYGLRLVNRASIVAEVEKLNSSHGKKLAPLIAAGVGYHHAGMEPDDKELIELAFKCGAISVLCATSSLAAGVNLPARRVIFRHPYVGRATNYLDAANYRQMRGRAGRAGIDTQGESFLLVLQKATEKMLAGLMHADPAPVESCLTQEKCGMKRAMLEVVASGAVISPSDVDRYIKCTLLAATANYEVVTHATKEALRWLGDRERQFIYWDKKTETFQPTAFGKAALGSGLPPEICIGIRADIARARQSFVLTTELHLAYLCVPATEDKGINFQWQRFELLLKNLSPSEKIVAEKVGINMAYVFQKARSFNTFIGATSTATAKPLPSSSTTTVTTSQQETKDVVNKASQQREELAAAMSEHDRICQRFGTALLLSDILREMNSQEIYAKYGLDRAVVLGLKDRACRYAGMLAVFCERLGWHDVELLVSKFQARVLYGVLPEVLCLIEIKFVQAATARKLYKAGLRTPEAVAAVPDVQRVVAALTAGRGDMSELEKANVSQQAKRIISNAKKLLETRAKKLKEDAAEALQLVESMNIDREGGNIGGGGNHIQNNVGRPVDAVPWQQQQQQLQRHQMLPFQQPQLQQGAQALLPAPLASPTTTPSSNSSLPPSLPCSLSPDIWEYGRTSGLITLSTIAHVQALKQVLIEGKHTAFAFQFDIVNQSGTMSLQHHGGGTGMTTSTSTGASSSGWSAMPGIPSAAAAAAQQQQHQQVALLQQKQSYLGGVALSWRENQAFYIPFMQESPQLPLNQLLFELAELFADAHFGKITFNFKGQLTALRHAAVHFSLPQLDTLVYYLRKASSSMVDVRIAAFLLHPEDDKLADGGGPGINGAGGPGSSSITNLQQYQYSKAQRTSNSYTAESLSASLLGPIAVAHATRSLPLLPPTGQQHSRSLNAPAAGMNGDYSTRMNSSLVTVAGRNVVLLNSCWPCLSRELQLKGLYDLFMNIEMPLVPILSAMEVAGVGADSEFLNNEVPVLRHRLTELQSLAEHCLLSAAGTMHGTGTASNLVTAVPFNINSTDECAEALYKTLKLAPPPSAVRLNNGTWSTRAENLEELAIAYPNCPLPGIISEYRTITKLQANCVELLHYSYCPTVVISGGNKNDQQGFLVMPRIHGTVNQTAAVTGRLSMESPNLQTVPKPFKFSIPAALTGGGGDGTSVGTSTSSIITNKEMRLPYVCTLRRGIIPPPGMVLLSADYKQLELRMMAHLSGDPLLVAMCRDTRIDPFIQLAARWLGKHSIDSVTPEDRARAKNLAYALLYGMGSARTALELGLRGPTAEKEAEALKASFLNAFPVLQQWINHVRSAFIGVSNNNTSTSCSAASIKKVGVGEVRTLFGRLRRFGNISIQGNRNNENLGNKALNTMTQGSAADVTKLGMLAVAQAIEKLNNNDNDNNNNNNNAAHHNFNFSNTTNNRLIARLVLSIHDEFLLEVDAQHVDRVARELRSAMEGVVPWLSVPLPVKISISRTSWGDMEELVL